MYIFLRAQRSHHSHMGEVWVDQDSSYSWMSGQTEQLEEREVTKKIPTTELHRSRADGESFKPTTKNWAQRRSGPVGEAAHSLGGVLLEKPYPAFHVSFSH